MAELIRAIIRRVTLPGERCRGATDRGYSGWGGEPVSVAYERAGTLCDGLGDDEQVGPTLFGLASNRVVRGQTRVAQGLAERCRTVAAATHPPMQEDKN